jgi:hypothetical protein
MNCVSICVDCLLGVPMVRVGAESDRPAGGGNQSDVHGGRGSGCIAGLNYMTINDIVYLATSVNQMIR